MHTSDLVDHSASRLTADTLISNRPEDEMPRASEKFLVRASQGTFRVSPVSHEQMKIARFALGLAATVVLASSAANKATRFQSNPGDATQRPEAAARANLSTNARPSSGPEFQQVLPILLGKCFRCHNNEMRILSNWLDYKTAFADRVEIKRRVWDSWRGRYFKQPMPAGFGPEAQAMTEEERRIIKEWVERGAPYGRAASAAAAASKAERIERGRQVYATICTPCHQPTGLGIPNQFPPLAGSDFLNTDKSRAISVLLHGLQGQVTVNGRVFNNSMPMLPLADEDIANALTYVYSSFGNSGQDVTPEEVAKVRRENVNPSMAGTPTQRSIQPTPPSPFE